MDYEIDEHEHDDDEMGRCILCGGLNANAEMYGPARHGFADTNVDHGQVHDSCGLAAGWDVA